MNIIICYLKEKNSEGNDTSYYNTTKLNTTMSVYCRCKLILFFGEMNGSLCGPSKESICHTDSCVTTCMSHVHIMWLYWCNARRKWLANAYWICYDLGDICLVCWTVLILWLIVIYTEHFYIQVVKHDMQRIPWVSHLKLLHEAWRNYHMCERTCN